MPPLDPKKASPKAPSHAFPEASLAPAPEALPESLAAPPAALSSAPSLGALWHSLRRSWVLVLPLALLAGLVGGAAAWCLVPAEYTSTVSFRIRAVSGMDGAEDFDDVKRTQLALVKSPEVLGEAIRRSHVADQYGVAYTANGLSKKVTAAYSDKQILTVSLSGESPEAVAAVLNALREAYPDRVHAGEQKRIKDAIEVNTKLLRETENQLRDARVLRNAAEAAAGIPAESLLASLQAEANTEWKMARDELKKLEDEVRPLESKKKRLEGYLKKWQEGALPDLSLAAGDPDIRDRLDKLAAYKKAQEDIGKIREEIDKTRRRVPDRAFLKESRKERAALTALLRESDRLVESEVKGVLLQVNSDLQDRAGPLARAKEQAQEARQKAERFKKDKQSVPPEVEARRDHVSQLETNLKKITEQDANLKNMMRLNRQVEPLAEAVPSTEKEYGKPLKYSLGAFALLFAVALVGGCLLEARHRRVSASDDVRDGLGLRVVGTIPALPSAARKKSLAALSLGGLDSQFGLTEAVDSVRTTLLHSRHADGARIVMITSAVTGEGKTTLASHLAASLARAWRKTLLIDADLRNPNANNQFDLPASPGLCEALRGEVEFEDAIKPTTLGRLWMLPAGQVDGHALQALTQDGLAEVFERLKDQFDFIVIDTSPVVPVPDALMLGKHADAVILSVMKDVSCMPAVYAAQQKLEDIGIRVLGAVVIGEKTETYGRPIPYGPPGGGV